MIGKLTKLGSKWKMGRERRKSYLPYRRLV